MIKVFTRNSTGCFKGLLAVCFFSTALSVGNATMLRAFAQNDQLAAAGKKDSKTYVLKRIYKKGELNRFKYHVNMTVTNPGDKAPYLMDITLISKEFAKNARKDGSYTVLTSYDSVIATIDGKRTDLTAAMPITTLIKNKHGLTDAKFVGGEKGVADQIKSLANVADILENVYCKDPVKIGEVWVRVVKVPAPRDLGESEAETTTKLIGTEKFRGLNAFKLSMKVKSTGFVNSTVQTTLFVEAGSGRLISVTSDSMGEVQGGLVKLKMTLELLTGDTKPKVSKSQ